MPGLLRAITLSTILAAASAAAAHTYSATPTVQARTTTIHSEYRTTASGIVVAGGLPGQIAAAGVTPYGESEITVYAVPSDAVRYQQATGRLLPAQHGIITLPPATPRGDFTYIWASPSGD